MICQLYRLLFFSFFLFFIFSCQKETVNKEKAAHFFQNQLDSLQSIYAPDKRVARFHTSLEQAKDGNCFVLRGQTNLGPLITALRQLIQRSPYCVQDSMLRLPVAALGKDSLGIVKVSVANLRSEPRHSAELATQALLGSPLKVLDRQGDWFLVQPPDRYLAWLEAGAFSQMDHEAMTAFYHSKLALVNRPIAQLTALGGGGKSLRDLSLGNIVKKLEQQANWQQIELPDGQKGWLPAEQLLDFDAWLAASEQLKSTEYAGLFYGLPYLWGGTSAKGLDCSGFTKMVYWLNGFVIPRDASQQVEAGEEVPLSPLLEEAKPGDLLFFGVLREDGSQRINHVGLYLGGGRFVHSGADNGFIKEESLLPDSPDFAPHRRASLLRIKRLKSDSKAVWKATEALFFWYQPGS